MGDDGGVCCCGQWKGCRCPPAGPTLMDGWLALPTLILSALIIMKDLLSGSLMEQDGLCCMWGT
jgi:hypothetical protein